MKYTQRLDNARLAEVLHERGMADLEPLRELLQQSRDGSHPFAESLVMSNIVGDWELSRTVCEIFNLPFLPIDVLTVDPELAKAMDCEFLYRHGLVPLSRFGQALTVVLPGMVQANVLGLLSTETDLVILPVVGTVETNRRWLKEHLGALQKHDEAGGDWSAMFDEADAAVQLEIDQLPEDELEFDEALDEALDEVLDEATIEDLTADELEEAGSIEFEDVDDDDLGSLEVDPPSLIDADELEEVSDGFGSGESGSNGDSSSNLELPPMPEFG
ncbi:MAG: hypothetical protein GY711_07585 [bacterium]|nr:hypothetical protein [bacterium]